jgi:predicted ester cyclase
MNTEELVRAAIGAIEQHDMARLSSYMSDDAGVLDAKLSNLALPKAAFLAQIDAILQAFPDWKYNILALSTKDDQVAVDVRLTATHNKTLNLPGMPPVPATGRQVSVPDRFVFTIRDSKISMLTIDSPEGGGAAEMMRQIGLG